MRNWLQKFRPHAERLLGDPAQAERFLSQVESKAQGQEERLRGFWSELKVFLSMLRSYLKGEYREVPYSALLSGLGALAYFVNPFDLIPDFILGGWVDDVMVLGWVFQSLRSEIHRYQSWHGQTP